MAFPVNLVRAYLRWPERQQFANLDDEVSSLRRFLDTSYHQIGEVVSDADLQQLVSFQHRREEGGTGRKEARIAEQIQVLLNVAGDAATSRCETRDIGVHGMRLQSSVRLPDGSSIQLTVAPSGFPITLFHLEAECRWITSAQDEGFQLGVEIREVADFLRWRDRLESADPSSD